ncbi:MAG TPA: alpha/beta fold hydrolase [Geobacteraceae bacterium]|nr:alpha/beta fold hydrolase [Geobacteraceae bacterium]
MRTLINGISLAYDDCGTGLPLLLIHGFPLSRRIWAPQLEELQGTFRIIAPDLRGFGESDVPEGPYSMDIFADDMIGLLDHLGIDRAAVCGMSMGGYILLNMLDRYPQRVRAACFMVTRGGADDVAGKERRLFLAREVLAKGPQVVTDAFSKILFSSRAGDEEADLIGEVSRIMAQTSTQGLAGGLLAMRERPDYTSRLADFRIPSLVIGAELDQAIPPAESRLLAERLPDARLVLVPDAGHMAGMENPAVVNRELHRFLTAIH